MLNQKSDSDLIGTTRFEVTGAREVYDMKLCDFYCSREIVRVIE
jgi:hypothetical protein